MAKAGDNRERAVAVAAAEEEDCSGNSDKGLGWYEKVDGSHSNLVNWLRGEGFGSIFIYVESQTVPTLIAVSPARIAKEYWLPNSSSWDIIRLLRMLNSTWNTHTHTRSCPGDKILSRGQNCFVTGTKSCPVDKILSLGQNCFVPLCPGQTNFVPAVYIACV